MISSEISPEFFGLIAGLLTGKTIRMGLIPAADTLPMNTIRTSPSTVIAAELNTVGHVRPSFVMPSIGAYNPTTGEWEFPPELAFTISGPVSFAQYFFLIGGVDTPRDTDREAIYNLSEIFDEVVVPSGASLTLITPWKIL